MFNDGLTLYLVNILIEIYQKQEDRTQATTANTFVVYRSNDNKWKYY